MFDRPSTRRNVLRGREGIAYKIGNQHDAGLIYLPEKTSFIAPLQFMAQEVCSATSSRAGTASLLQSVLGDAV